MSVLVSGHCISAYFANIACIYKVSYVLAKTCTLTMYVFCDNHNEITYVKQTTKWRLSRKIRLYFTGHLSYKCKKLHFIQM